MENCSKTRSQFSGEKLQFFRQIEGNLSTGSIYYIKPLWKNATSNFLGNFGPGFSIDFNRGGFDLPFGVKNPDLDRFVQNLQTYENYLTLPRNSSKIVYFNKYFYYCKNLVKILLYKFHLVKIT